jgi:ABC-type oligopeptide transport system substrate-binding subunit
MQEFSQAWGGQVISNGFVMTLSYNTGSTQRQRLAEILESGIEGLTTTFRVSVVELAWDDFLYDMRNAHFPLFRAGWIQDIPHPHNWVVPYFIGVRAQDIGNRKGSRHRKQDSLN